MKCDVCGVESDFDAGFVKQPAAVGRFAKTLCPGCWVKRSNFRRAWFLPSLVIAGAFGYVANRLLPGGSFLGHVLTNICFIGVFVVLTILPHELGHAIVARAVGWRVYQIVIGIGKPLLKRRWFGVLVDIRTLPIAGATWIAPKNTRWYRLKRFVTILAGPAVNAGMAVGVAVVIQGNLRNFDYDALPTWARLFVMANVFVVVVNLWPHQPKSGFDLPTDGKQLLQLISFRKDAIDQVQAQRFTFEAMLCRERSDLEGARSWCDKGLALYPEDLHLLNVGGIVYLDEQKYELARGMFLKLLSKEKQPPAMRFLLLNNLAYADALSEKPELLPEADNYSRDAYAGLPWMPSIVGTRGTVLVAMGKYDAGMVLLKKSMEDADTARSKAENACHMAMALKKSGRTEEARKYLQLAQQLDAKCILLSRVETRLGLVSPGSRSDAQC